MRSSRGSSQPRDQTQVSLIAGGLFTVWATREAHQGNWFLGHLHSHTCPLLWPLLRADLASVCTWPLLAPSPPLSDSLLSWGGSQWWQISCSFFTWSIHPTRAVSQKVNLIRRAVKKEVLRHRGWNLKLIFQSWVSDGQARRSRKSQFEIFTGNSWHKDLDPFQSSQAFASLLSYESKKSWLLPKVWSFQLISKTVKKILIAA